MTDSASGAPSNILDRALATLAASDPALAAAARREVDALRDGRKFGLVFNRHLPESVRLPNHPIKRGVKVTLRNPSVASKTEKDAAWRVTKVETVDGTRVAHLVGATDSTPASDPRPVSDLVVVREFGEPVYPGLKPVERIERGGDAPFHTVINGENLHALQALRMTHRGAVDLIYIDPPYNTGNQGWIYNDKYVDVTKGDASSKWLSFMERRLVIARELLKDTGALVMSIGSDEVHRLVILAQQVFRAHRVQTICVQTSGGKPSGGLNYLHEYLVCVTPADFIPQAMSFTGGKARTPWEGLTLATFDKTQRPNQAYPIFVDRETGLLHSVGLSLEEKMANGTFQGEKGDYRYHETPPPGTVAVWPITAKGDECVWRLIPSRVLRDWQSGYIKISQNRRAGAANAFSIQYLPAGTIDKIARGELEVTGTEGSAPTLTFGANTTSGADIPTIWSETSHRTTVGTGALREVLGDKRFPYPKPVPLISDVIRAFSQGVQDAVVLDFFGGSGTTAEAVMRLNAEDGGTRQAILVTNNELGVKDAKALAKDGYAPGDPEWEARGVFEYVTRPRISTVVTGVRPDGSTYSDGLAANVEFFTMTYLDESRVSRAREYEAIAPLLWMATGANGERIATEPETGWALTEHYGVLFTEDATKPFLKAVAEQALSAETAPTHVFVVTDSDSHYTDVAGRLPSGTKAVRLYESYLKNFEINVEVVG